MSSRSGPAGWESDGEEPEEGGPEGWGERPSGTLMGHFSSLASHITGDMSMSSRSCQLPVSEARGSDVPEGRGHHGRN